MSAPLLLLRWLVLALCFHTVAGVPLHEAQHLREAATATLVVVVAHADADAAPLGAPSTDPEQNQDAEAHGLCTWCHAYASQDQGLPAHALPLAARAPPVLRALTGAVAVAHPGHWRFAARDPPAYRAALG